jgi:hypothetical protein
MLFRKKNGKNFPMEKNTFSKYFSRWKKYFPWIFHGKLAICA